MALFKQILVPLDFSTPGNAVVQLAADMAGRLHGSLTLLHVHDPLPYALPAEYELFTPEQRERLQAEIEKALAAAKRRAQTAGALEVQTKCIAGNAAEQIVEFARAGNFDLIVMGTRGRRGIQHALLGSVAERVVRTAPCAVLTVRSPEDPASEAKNALPPTP